MHLQSTLIYTFCMISGANNNYYAFTGVPKNQLHSGIWGNSLRHI